MEVKSAFLNECIMDEVYVQQPPGFEDNLYPNHVFKFQNPCMVLDKLLKLVMKDQANFLLRNALKKGSLLPHISQKRKGKKNFLYKYMLMILSLILLTLSYIKNF